MKIRLWIFLVVVGVLLMVIHEIATGGRTILSDIADDPTVSDGPIWFVGAIGTLSFFGGFVLLVVGRIQRRNDLSDAEAVQAKQRTEKTLEFLERPREA